MITINEEKTLEKIQIVSWLKNSTNKKYDVTSV